MITLPGFDIGNLVDAGLAYEEQDEWHAPEPCPRGCIPRRAKRDCPDCNGEGQVWYWHASSLAFCTRAAVLKRANLAPDGTPRSGLLTFALGHAIHDRYERWSQNYAKHEPRWQHVAAEVGGKVLFDGRARLAAKCDILGRWDGVLAILEVKSEKGGTTCGKCGAREMGAAHYRKKEAQELGYEFPIKYEHWLQGTCQVVALEQVMAVHDGHPPTNHNPAKCDACKAATGEETWPEIAAGRILYVNKTDWWQDAYPADFGNADMRAEVKRRTLELEDAWQAYRRRSVLPPRLVAEKAGKEPWQCSRRTPMEQSGDDDPRGRFCPARSVCFARP